MRRTDARLAVPPTPGKRPRHDGDHEDTGRPPGPTAHSGPPQHTPDRALTPRGTAPGSPRFDGRRGHAPGSPDRRARRPAYHRGRGPAPTKAPGQRRPRYGARHPEVPALTGTPLPAPPKAARTSGGTRPTGPLPWARRPEAATLASPRGSPRPGRDARATATPERVHGARKPRRAPRPGAARGTLPTAPLIRGHDARKPRPDVPATRAWHPHAPAPGDHVVVGVTRPAIAGLASR